VRKHKVHYVDPSEKGVITMVESVDFVVGTRITVGENLDIFFGPRMNMRDHEIPVVKMV